MTKKYDASEILVLEGIDPVRRRPAMYIGGTDKTGLHHLVWEILDNAIDEVMNGYATTITVELDKNGGGIRVTDNGRGIPVDQHKKYKKSALEIIMTTLHAGGKFETGSYIPLGRLARGRRLGGQCLIRSPGSHRPNGMDTSGSNGTRPVKPLGPVTKGNPVRGTGTSVYFRPRPGYFRQADDLRLHPVTQHPRSQILSSQRPQDHLQGWPVQANTRLCP